MNIYHPRLLLLLILLLLCVLLVIIYPRSLRRKFARFAQEDFFGFYFKNWSLFFWRLKAVLLILAFGFLVLALARPQWDRETQELTGRSLDIAVCVDVSKSMETKDFPPNRLQRAKDQIAAFIDELQGDRIALIPFAGSAYVECPLTDDYDAVKMLLSSLSPYSVPVWGTDIGMALRTVKDVFDNDSKNRVVILISDGEDLEGEGIKEAKELAAKGVIIYTLGVGTPEGARVDIEGGANLPAGVQRDVVSKLDITTLEKIASASGGQFYMVTPAQDEIQAILKHISSLERNRLSSRRFNLYKEQYQIFAIMALLLILTEVLLTARTSRNKLNNFSKTILLLFLFLLPVFRIQALKLSLQKVFENSKGSYHYKSKDYSKAKEVFEKNTIRHPKDNTLHYNYGNALYRMNNNKEAAAAWQNTAKSKNPKLRSQAFHNLGNALYNRKQYAEALQMYRNAVLANPENLPAKANYELAKQMLKEQQQQQQKQQQQQSDKEKDKEKQPNSQQQKQEDSEQQEKEKAAERMMKALEQKEINDRKNRQAPPQRLRSNKWW